MIFIAFDPGKSGGLCAMNDKEKILALMPMPMVTVTEKRKERSVYGVARIRQLLVELIARDRVVEIGRAHV